MKDLDILDGDLLFVAGDIAFVSGVDAIRQKVLLRLRRGLGEWAYNETLGLPWIDQILVKNPDIAAIRSLLTAEIAATPGVLQVVTLELELTTARVMTFTWSVLVADGATFVEVTDSTIATYDAGELQFIIEPLGMV